MVLQTQTQRFFQTRLRFSFPWTRTFTVTRTRFFTWVSFLPARHFGFFAASLATTPPRATPKAIGAKIDVIIRQSERTAVSLRSTGATPSGREGRGSAAIVRRDADLSGRSKRRRSTRQSGAMSPSRVTR